MIVPLLPVLSGLDPLSSLQVSLLLIFTISLINSLSFLFQKLILWSWLFKGLTGALFFAFLSGIFVSHLTSLQIRFILWLFLFFILLLPLLLIQIPLLRTKGFYLFSSLMGLCSGLTGLGGGMILSPYLHESERMPAQNIPAVVSCIMFFVSSFSLLGQISQKGFSFIQSSEAWFFYWILFIPAFFGLFIGYVVNLKQKNIKLRRLLLRIGVWFMFLKMTVELGLPVFYANLV